MKIIAKKSVIFPSFGFGISEGDIIDLPEDKELAKELLKSPFIEKYEKPVSPKQ